MPNVIVRVSKQCSECGGELQQRECCDDNETVYSSYTICIDCCSSSKNELNIPKPGPCNLTLCYTE